MKRRNPTEFRGVVPHPEWTVRDVDSSPGHHDGVLHRFRWRVGAGVCAISIILNLDVYRVSFNILVREQV